jgi:hypothetical protein
MKKILIPLLLVSLLAGVAVPTSTALAAAPPQVGPIIFYICGPSFYYDAVDYHAHIVGIVDAYPAGGGPTTSYWFYEEDPQPNAQWQSTGFAIDHLNVWWGNPVYAEGYFVATGDSCSGGGLINMYVYYSATPFFGETNTITLYSAAGFPSREAVTAAAGGKLPEGFSYGAPACWGALVDNGTDQGFFACDAFLANLGERRAWLHNDPDGPAFDLLPKIHSYITMLDGLGITPDLPDGTTVLSVQPYGPV